MNVPGPIALDKPSESFQFMVVGSLSWSLLLVSHLLRSIWDWRAPTRLELDLAGLRLEVHRAPELLESYNLVVDDCHAQVSWLRSANYSVTSVNILLGILVFGLAFWTFLVRGPIPLQWLKFLLWKISTCPPLKWPSEKAQLARLTLAKVASSVFEYGEKPQHQ